MVFQVVLSILTHIHLLEWFRGFEEVCHVLIDVEWLTLYVTDKDLFNGVMLVLLLLLFLDECSDDALLIFAEVEAFEFACLIVPKASPIQSILGGILLIGEVIAFR